MRLDIYKRKWHNSLLMFVRMECKLCEKIKPMIDDIYDLTVGMDQDSIVVCLLRHAMDDLCIILELHDLPEGRL